MGDGLTTDPCSSVLHYVKENPNSGMGTGPGSTGLEPLAVTACHCGLPGEAAEDGSDRWVYALTWETQRKLLGVNQQVEHLPLSLLSLYKNK